MNDSAHWHITCKNSKLLIAKLNHFFIMHQALSQELSVAKSLGTCQITTLQKGLPSFRSLDSMLKSGKGSMRTVTTHTRSQSLKELT